MKPFGTHGKRCIFNIKIDSVDPKASWDTRFHIEDGRKGYYYPGRDGHLMKVGHCYVIQADTVHTTGDGHNFCPNTRLSYITIVKEL